MANIVNFTTDVVGQVGQFLGGVVPRRVKMVVSDNLATVTGSGYLSQELMGGFALYPTDLIDMWYGYVSSANPGTYGVFIPTFSNGVISLVQQSSGILSSITTLNASAVNGAYATPFQLVAAPGSGLVLVPIAATIYTNVSTAFASGGTAIVQYGNTVHGAGTDALSGTIASSNITAAASQIYNLAGNTGNALTGITNQGLFFSNATGAFTTGTGSSVVITLQYMIVTATV